MTDIVVASAAIFFILKRAWNTANSTASITATKPTLTFGTTRGCNNPEWIFPVQKWLCEGVTVVEEPKETIKVVDFGEPTRHLHFSSLDPTFPSILNHGSYGASLDVTTHSATQWNQRLESQPVRFMESQVLPELVDTIRKIAFHVLGVPPEHIALVENATTAVNAVARSMIVSSKLVGPGDYVLCFDKSYGACVSALDLACRDVGATLVRMSVSAATGTNATKEGQEKDDDILLNHLKVTLHQLNGKCKFIMFDLCTSVPPRIFPIQKMCHICHEYDPSIKILVDGAHGVGNVQFDVNHLGCDYFTSNLHKWYCTPKGTAILWVKDPEKNEIKPSVISHGYGQGFSSEFIWKATKDYGKFLSIRQSIQWHTGYGLNRVMKRNQDLVMKGATIITSMIPKSRILSHDEMCLCVIELPEKISKSCNATTFPRSKYQPTTMEMCRKCLKWLDERGIQVVVWDMDHTMSSKHCGDGLELDKLEEYVQSTSKDFVALSRALAFKKYKQALATGSDPAEYELPNHSRCTHICGPDLAKKIIQTHVLKALPSFEIMVGYDHRLHTAAPKDDGSTLVNNTGKRHHLRRIQQHYNVPYENMLLIDDSPSSLVNEDGWSGLLVHDRTIGFQFSDMLGKNIQPMDTNDGMNGRTTAQQRLHIRDQTTGLIDATRLHVVLRERGVEVVCYRSSETNRVCVRLSASSYNTEREYELLGFHLLALLQE